MSYARKLARRLYATYMGFEEHEGSLAAAGIAYYLALSFFPLFMVLLAGLGWVLAWTAAGQEAQQSLLAAIEQQVSPDLARPGRAHAADRQRQSADGRPNRFCRVCLISAIATFAQLDAAFDRIWHQPTDPHETWMHWIVRLLVKRVKALAMLLGVGGFVIIAMVTSMIWSGVKQSIEPTFTMPPWFEWASSLWINLLLNFLAFTMIYKVLPKPRIRWRDAVHGGIFAALLWEAGGRLWPRICCG